eukprot:TRINITY_DN30679_c0_g1_i2.p1 TRINITY_DN30679_c0_g1~~TRINITY_DN30679_c0_g1_i2.p1  ORF type:complete len:141 (-),score=29.50 TRINITY_DN30679_c0_g1_i2:86-508(-)
MIGGSVAGVLAGVLLMGFVFELAKYVAGEESVWCTEDKDVNLKELIESLKEQKEVTTEAILALRRNWDLCFSRPLARPEENDTCIICQEPFEDDGKGMQAVRAPLCEGKHFVHHICEIEMMCGNQDFRCCVCRTGPSTFG